MSEFEEKLNAILSNPEAMAQVAQLAQSLNPGSSSQPPGPEPPKRDPTPSPQPDTAPSSHPTDQFGQLDPELLRRFLPLLGELGGGESQDQRMNLLRALGPFLRPERREKIDRAIKAAHLIHIGKQFLSGLGAGHV